ncbi:META domain-containing protein [Pseudoroseomonas globiformis]|uniref:META domain-containing protein n=1 Tax=Teichococcus globiformis TaxID=2307229 RepID=A0ABV7G1A7_9PROT
MNRAIPAVALAALLAACSAAPQSPQGATGSDRTAGAATPPVEAVDWRLADAGAVARLPSLRLDPVSRRASGSGGCNRLAGPYMLDGARLRIGPLASTRMACLDPAASALEARFLAALDATASYRIGGGFLTLLDAAGRPLLKLEPAG